MAFVTSLRVEMRKYGVDVINFTPGSFVTSSNILAEQEEFSHQQRLALNDEQKHFFGDYFDRFHACINQLSGIRSVEVYNESDGMMQTFESALLDQVPKPLYLYEPTRR